ncbi:MAG: histidinol-phosphate transaminase [Candidatus Sumerlaeota bacterium]|nr:histidinol-phosphate transaminase [Candidatus Sumerlaeota bacterium]
MSVKPTKIVQSLKPYVPGEQPQDGGFIKLNTNENPYPPAPEVIEAFRQAMPERLRLYPDPLCVELRTLLVERHKGSVSQIFVGNGSDEVLRLLFQAYLGAGDAVAMVNPTYSLYPVIAAQLGVRTKIFELGPDGEMPDFPALSSFKVFIIASPNPPYGTFYPEETLERLIKSAPSTLFIIDEAYVDFASGDATALVARYSNVVICRSYSKAFSLAGVRLGYAFGTEDIIENLFKLKDSYNVDYLSQTLGCAAVRAQAYYAGLAVRIREDRAFLTTELRRLGFKVYDSQGNFIFAENGDGGALYESLKKKMILVRYFDTPRLRTGVRITIGTRKELEALLKALRDK